MDCNSVFMPVVPESWDTSGTETRWAFIPLPVLLDWDQDLDGSLHHAEDLCRHVYFAYSRALWDNDDSSGLIEIH